MSWHTPFPQNPRVLLAALAGAVALPTGIVSASVGEASEVRSEAEVTACVQRNHPEPDSIRGMRITTRDPRQSSKTVTVVKMFGRRTDDGRRQLLVKFLRPEDVAGSAMLLLETGNATDVYLASPEIPEPRRISGSGRSTQLFGTTLSYEDFEWVQGFRLPAQERRLADETVRDRPVYVVESRPEQSAYERVVSYVDQESCLPLRMEFYETGGRLRKQLTTNPGSNLKHGSTWVAHRLLMSDEVDLATTHLMVDSHEQDVLLPGGTFSVEGLEAVMLLGESDELPPTPVRAH